MLASEAELYAARAGSLMEVLFFGPSARQLLGVYHPADMSRDRYQGVVLCYPFGQEYMRAHRAFRQLATSLAKKGYHVLRFDYRGTGDSGGDLNEVTALDWLEDIECAVQELKDMAGVHSITLVGLRLGALLAATVAARRHNVSGLVVWDPIVAGGDYVQQMLQKVEQAPPHKRQSQMLDAHGNLHFNGFHMSAEFQASLQNLNLLEQRPACRRIYQVVSHQNRHFDKLAEAWGELEGFEFAYVPAEHDWNYVDHVGGILLPQPVLLTISNWI